MSAVRTERLRAGVNNKPVRSVAFVRAIHGKSGCAPEVIGRDVQYDVGDRHDDGDAVRLIIIQKKC